MKGIIHAYAVILMGLGLVVGCGSTHEKQTLTAGNEPLTVISGKVAPGSVWKGRVTAVELDRDSNIVNHLGQTLSDENGAYQITVEEPYEGGVILITMQSGPDTRMKCPVPEGCSETEFGGWMVLPPDVSVTAVCAPTGSKATAHITPLTHMAAVRLFSSGQITPYAAGLANSEINQMAGINALTCDIGDLTQKDAISRSLGPSFRHALFLTGMADYLSRSSGTTYGQGLKDLADAFQEGTLRSDMTREIIDRVEHAMVNVPGILGVSGLYSGDMIMSHTALESIISSLDTRDYNPEPSNGAGKTAVTQAKLLLKQARTIVMQLIDYSEDPLMTLDIESVNVNSFMGKDMHHLARILGETFRQVLETTDLYGMDGEDILTLFDQNREVLGELCVTPVTPKSGGRAWLFNGDLWDGGPVTVRDLILKTSLGDDTLSRLDSLVNEDVFLFIDGKIGSDLMEIHFRNTGLTVSVRDRKPASMVFKGAVLIRLADRTFSGEAEIAWNAGETTPEFSILSWGSLDENQELSFNSQARVSLDPVVDMDTVRFDASRIAVKGCKTISFDDLGETTRARLESYADECSESFETRDSVSMTYPEMGRVALTCRGVDQNQVPAVNTISFDLFQSLERDLTEGIADDYGLLALPSDLSFHTEVFDQIPVISLSYLLTLSDYDDLFFTGHLTLTASAVIPDMPALTATISVSRTHEAGGSLSMTVGNNGRSYTLYLESADLSADRVGMLILSNPDDVKFVIYPNMNNYRTSYGTVSVGRETVGTIQVVNSIPLVRYVDGTFESLF